MDTDDVEKITLEGQAVTEILNEAKRGKELAREYGALAWQKSDVQPNKRFLNNTLVSTLRHSYREDCKRRDGSYKKYQQHMANRGKYFQYSRRSDDNMEEEEESHNVDYGEFDAAKYSEQCTEMYVRDSQRKHARMREMFVERRTPTSDSESSQSDENAEEKAEDRWQHDRYEDQRPRTSSAREYHSGNQRFQHRPKYADSRGRGIRHKPQQDYSDRWNRQMDFYDASFAVKRKREMVFVEETTSESDEVSEASESEDNERSKSAEKPVKVRKLPKDGKTLIEKISERSMYADVEEIKQGKQGPKHADRAVLEDRKLSRKTTKYAEHDFDREEDDRQYKRHKERKLVKKEIRRIDYPEQERDDYFRYSRPHGPGHRGRFMRRGKRFNFEHMFRGGFRGYPMFPPINPFYASYMSQMQHMPPYFFLPNMKFKGERYWKEQATVSYYNPRDSRSRSHSRSKSRSHKSKKRKRHYSSSYSDASSYRSRSKSKSRERSSRKSRKHRHRRKRSSSYSDRKSSRSSSRSSYSDYSRDRSHSRDSYSSSDRSSDSDRSDSRDRRSRSESERRRSRSSSQSRSSRSRSSTHHSKSRSRNTKSTHRSRSNSRHSSHSGRKHSRPKNHKKLKGKKLTDDKSRSEPSKASTSGNDDRSISSTKDTAGGSLDDVSSSKSEKEDTESKQGENDVEESSKSIEDVSDSEKAASDWSTSG